MLFGANTVLEVEQVSKLFTRSDLQRQRRLSQVVQAACFGREFNINALQKHEFWALDNVSFSLDRSEAIGIIGLNGAGKTTLLRMLNGQFPPDKGEIRIAGKTAAMIDLTEGFNARMTGRENLYLRSAVLGMPREEVEEYAEEIITFTELGEAIDAPIATYSSGMRMRLAFATTVFVEPDLLIIDEVLSVGDFQFRQKCLERIRQLREKAAFVFSSHSMNDISRFCNKAIVLRKGNITFQGVPDDAIKFYLEQQQEEKAKSLAIAPKLGHFIHNENVITNISVRFLDQKNQEKALITRGEKLTVDVSFRVSHAATELTVGLPIWSSDEIMVTAFATKADNVKINAEPGQHIHIQLTLDTDYLNPDDYKTVLVLRDGAEFLYRQEVGSFTIEDKELLHHWGKAQLPHEWKIIKKDHQS